MTPTYDVFVSFGDQSERTSADILAHLVTTPTLPKPNTITKGTGRYGDDPTPEHSYVLIWTGLLPHDVDHVRRAALSAAAGQQQEAIGFATTTAGGWLTYTGTIRKDQTT